MRDWKLVKLLVLCAAVGTALVATSSAFAWTVTLTADPKLKRTYSWKIEKSVSKAAVTVKTGETAVVTYTVTATPTGSVDSDFRVDGTAHLSRDPNIDVTDVDVAIQVQDVIHDPNAIPAAVSCNPTFPVDLAVSDVNCVYGVALPNTTPRNVVMRATLVGGGRVVTQEFDFTNPTVDLVDESVSVTDSMGGVLGTVNAADGPKTFTYTKTIGPYTKAQCGSKTINNTATFTTSDSAATGSASAAVAVTVKCDKPKECKDDKGGKGGHDDKYGKGGHDDKYGKGGHGDKYGKGGHDDDDCDDGDDCRDDHKSSKGGRDDDCDDDGDDCRGDHKSSKGGYDDDRKSGHSSKGGNDKCDDDGHNGDDDHDDHDGGNNGHDRDDCDDDRKYGRH